MTTATFTMTCPCGETFEVIEGQEQPHECRPITAQQVRDAWAEGYEFARQEWLGLLARLAPPTGLLVPDEHGKQHCAFCGEQRGWHFLVHTRDCPWDEARTLLDHLGVGPASDPGVRDEPPYVDSAPSDPTP